MFEAMAHAAGFPRITSVIPTTTDASCFRLTVGASAFRSSTSCWMRTGATITATAPGIRNAHNGRGPVIGGSHCVIAPSGKAITCRGGATITCRRAATITCRIRAIAPALRGMTASHRKARRMGQATAGTSHHTAAVAAAEQRGRRRGSLTPRQRHARAWLSAHDSINARINPRAALPARAGSAVRAAGTASRYPLRPWFPSPGAASPVAAATSRRAVPTPTR